MVKHLTVAFKGNEQLTEMCEALRMSFYPNGSSADVAKAAGILTSTDTGQEELTSLFTTGKGKALLANARQMALQCVLDEGAVTEVGQIGSVPEALDKEVETLLKTPARIDDHAVRLSFNTRTLGELSFRLKAAKSKLSERLSKEKAVDITKLDTAIQNIPEKMISCKVAGFWHVLCSSKVADVLAELLKGSLTSQAFEQSKAAEILFSPVHAPIIGTTN